MATAQPLVVPVQPASQGGSQLQPNGGSVVNNGQVLVYLTSDPNIVTGASTSSAFALAAGAAIPWPQDVPCYAFTLNTQGQVYVTPVQSTQFPPNANAESLLAAVAPNDPSVAVTVSSTIAYLRVIIKGIPADVPATFTVTGLDSGYTYQVVGPINSDGSDAVFYSLIAPALDINYLVQWATTPTQPWVVLGEYGTSTLISAGGGGGGTGTITEITSSDGSVVITNASGPITDLSVVYKNYASYASLTGAGASTSPGSLQQDGQFTVVGANLDVVNGNIQVTNGSLQLINPLGGGVVDITAFGGGITINDDTNTSPAILIKETGGGGIQIQATLSDITIETTGTSGGHGAIDIESHLGLTMNANGGNMDIDASGAIVIDSTGGGSVTITGAPITLNGYVPTLNLVEDYSSAPINSSASAPVDLASVALGVGTWIVTGRSDITNNGGATQYAELFLGPTSTSVSGAYAASSLALTASTPGDTHGSISITKEIVLVAPTTVYLELASPGSTTITAENQTLVSNLPNACGITALQVA